MNGEVELEVEVEVEGRSSKLVVSETRGMVMQAR
jgi:hypothetical protein